MGFAKAIQPSQNAAKIIVSYLNKKVVANLYSFDGRTRTTLGFSNLARANHLGLLYHLNSIRYLQRVQST